MHSGPEPAASRYSWYVVTVLLAVYMVHHLDRMIVTLLLEPIGRDFDFSDSQLGLLAGLAYAVPFAIAGLPLGMLVLPGLRSMPRPGVAAPSLPAPPVSS